MSFDLDDLVGETQRPKRRRTKLESNLVRSDVSPNDVAAAKGDKLVKGRKRKTIYLPPELIEQIDAAAKDEGVKIADFYHWLFVEAWKLYKDGKIRPEVTEVVQVIRGMSIDGYSEEV